MPRLVEHELPPEHAELNLEHFEQEFARLLELVRNYNPEVDGPLLEQAFRYAYELHDGPIVAPKLTVEQFSDGHPPARRLLWDAN